MPYYVTIYSQKKYILIIVYLTFEDVLIAIWVHSIN